MGFRGFFSLLVFAAAHLARAGGASVTIATYNIENYGLADRMTADGYRQNYPKPESEKQALRKVIAGLNPDILFIQEMGPRPYLEELRADLRKLGLNYATALLVEAADPDRHLAVLSRIVPVRVRSHLDLKFKYFGTEETVKRGLLEFAFADPGGEITCFAVHLKSRLLERADDPQSEIRRAAEAGAVRDRVLAEFPHPSEARIIILGDCNDGQTSRSLARLQQRGNIPIAALLPAHDSKGEAWTHNYAKEETYTRLDHVLVSAALIDEIAGHAATIYDGPGSDTASDHRPVSIKLIHTAPGRPRSGISPAQRPETVTGIVSSPVP